jgi:hypothetical protein
MKEKYAFRMRNARERALKSRGGERTLRAYLRSFGAGYRQNPKQNTKEIKTVVGETVNRFLAAYASAQNLPINTKL